MALLLMLLPLLLPTVVAQSECPLDSVVNLKIQAALAGCCSTPQEPAVNSAELVCTDVNARGSLVSCPSGFKATACACGMGCGSWDIRSDTSCHCQCQGIDWTSARCCRIQLHRA
ncbi:resistin isoform X2 [Alligator sinensis]|uniref:Resistin isoform X1 n=1 Tax=Alligator sinensis TaxID=38654 RepID=A0A3Q0FMR6_ALLSI|nr:resistin isoform X1 [Alligator sinensis]XP_025048557.1 resistin isoform X2 [Alligator sinensis]